MNALYSWSLGVLTLTVLLLPTPVQAQAADSVSCSAVASRNAPLRKLAAQALRREVDISPQLAVRAVVEGLVADRLFADAETLLLDRQIGAGGTAPGTTSLVSKARTGILGLAVEHGAVSSQSNEDGTTLTFSGRPMDFIKGRGESFLNSIVNECDDSLLRFLGRFSVSATFRTQGGEAPEPQLNEKNLTAFTVKVEVFNTRDSRRAARGSALMQTVQLNPLGTDERLAPFVDDAAVTDVFGMISSTVERTPGAATPEAIDALAQRLSAAVEANRTAVDEFVGGIATGIARGRESQFMREASRGALLTFELAFDRTTAGTTPLWNLGAIYETGLWGGRAELTANAAAVLFHSLPTDPIVAPAQLSLRDQVAGRLHDWHVSSQVDVRLGTARNNVGVFSSAFKFQQLHENIRTTDLGSIAYDNGNVAVLQVKWTLPTKAGATLTPFSYTKSNRSDVSDEGQSSASAGLTFDLNQIFTGFK